MMVWNSKIGVCMFAVGTCSDIPQSSTDEHIFDRLSEDVRNLEFLKQRAASVSVVYVKNDKVVLVEPEEKFAEDRKFPYQDQSGSIEMKSWSDESIQQLVGQTGIIRTPCEKVEKTGSGRVGDTIQVLNLYDVMLPDGSIRTRSELNGLTGTVIQKVPDAEITQEVRNVMQHPTGDFWLIKFDEASAPEWLKERDYTRAVHVASIFTVDGDAKEWIPEKTKDVLPGDEYWVRFDHDMRFAVGFPVSVLQPVDPNDSDGGEDDGGVDDYVENNFSEGQKKLLQAFDDINTDGTGWVPVLDVQNLVRSHGDSLGLYVDPALHVLNYMMEQDEMLFDGQMGRNTFIHTINDHCKPKKLSTPLPDKVAITMLPGDTNPISRVMDKSEIQTEPNTDITDAADK